jgi:hypothetical protein
MINRIQRITALWVAVILIIAAAGIYFMRSFHGDPTQDGNNKKLLEENAAALFSPRASGQSLPGSSSPTAESRMAGSQDGDALNLLEEWLQSIGKNDGNNGAINIYIVIPSLRNNPNGNTAFYQRVRQVLERSSIDNAKKQELIMALDRAATPAAARLLAELSQLNLPTGLRQSVLGALANIGEYYWDKQSLATVIPTLQQLWLQSEDPELLRSVATALAKIGDAASINVLLQIVLSDTKSMNDIEHSNDPRTLAAWFALQRLQNPDAVPVLQKNLQSSVNLFEASISANLLAGMGSNDAVQALLSWAEGAGDKYAPVVRNAFARIGIEDSRQYIRSVLDQNPVFKSNLVRSAIIATLK